MCIIGKDLKIIQVSEDNPIIGFKIWRKFKTDNLLKSSSADFLWNPGTISGNVKDSERGVFSWNNYNCYNYYYYNNYYNYYDYNYNYNYNNYDDDYYIFGEISQFGEVHKHEKGYRSEFAKPKLLLNLPMLPNREAFINHFNNIIDDLAKIYDVKVELFNDYILRNKNNESI